MKLDSLGQERIKMLICIFLLFSAGLSIFSYTVEIREPWFGELSANHHQWLTGSTGIYTTNWYEEGPLNLKFAMLDNPKSIEFQNISSRTPYTSYPPGTIIPIYLFSELTSHKPTVAMIMEYNLLNHFLIAFILGLTIFFFLRQLKIDMVNSFLFSLIPIILELLLPAPLYWFQNVFFSDQAIILPFVLYIFLEVLRDGIYGKNLRILNIIQNLVLFYGFLTDWLFVFLALTVYIKRVVDGEIVLNRQLSHSNLHSFLKTSLKYWLVPIIAVSLFILQVFVMGEAGNTVSRFLFRTGLSQTGLENLYDGFNTLFGFFITGYGAIGLFLLLVSIGICIYISFLLISKSYKKKSHKVVKLKKIFYLIGLFIIPCVLQVFFFFNHTIWHDFSVLKFSVAISTVPLVLLPVMIFLLTENSMGEGFKSRFTSIFNLFQRFQVNPRLFIIFLLAFSATLGYVTYEFPNYSKLFPEPNDNYEVIGSTIQNNTVYNDIVFSPDFEIPVNPPQQLFYSMKRVYQINSIEDIKNKVNGLNNYNIVIIFVDPPSSYWKKVLVNSTHITNGFNYYYVNPKNI